MATLYLVLLSYFPTPDCSVSMGQWGQSVVVITRTLGVSDTTIYTPGALPGEFVTSKGETCMISGNLLNCAL